MRFKPDTSETGNDPVAEGVYTLSVFGNPKVKISKGQKTAGQPYMTFQLNHVGSPGGPPVYERVFTTGKQAFRFVNLMKALGLSDAEIKDLDIETVGEPTTEADVDSILLVGGAQFQVAGKTVSALLGVEEGDGDFGPKNHIKKYLK